MSEPKKHHFVPRFYLEAWNQPDGNGLYVFDKTTRNVFRANPKDVAFEKYLYHLPGEKPVVEAFLSRLESRTKPILNSIRTHGGTEHLHLMERIVLYVYFSAQLQRTPAGRVRYEQFRDALMFAWEDEMTDSLQAELAAFDAAQAHRDFIKAVPLIAEAMTHLRFCVLTNQTDLPFTTSDNPLVTHNMFESKDWWRGNLGVKSPGVELHLPLGPNTALIALDATPWPRRIHPSRANITDKRNVIFERSKQAQEAVRFVFSSSDNFDLERQMLEDTPELGDPDRPRAELLWMGRDLMREHYEAKKAKQTSTS